MPFIKGQSGNKNGRPRGVISGRAQLVQLIQPHAPELIERLISLAKGGDIAALKICIERLIPKTSQEPTGIKLPNRMDENGEKQLKEELLHAAIDGRISVADADKFMQLINNIYKRPENSATINFKTMSPTEAAKIYKNLMQR